MPVLGWGMFMEGKVFSWNKRLCFLWISLKFALMIYFYYYYILTQRQSMHEKLYLFKLSKSCHKRTYREYVYPAITRHNSSLRQRIAFCRHSLLPDLLAFVKLVDPVCWKTQMKIQASIQHLKPWAYSNLCGACLIIINK